MVHCKPSNVGRSYIIQSFLFPPCCVSELLSLALKFADLRTTVAFTLGFQLSSDQGNCFNSSPSACGSLPDRFQSPWS